jgi:phosphate transport system substrate-binding protein
MKKTLLFLTLVTLVLAPATPAAQKTLTIEGSTTVGPIADAFTEAFGSMYPELEITVKKTGSGDGAAALVDGRCEIANMSRFMKESEFKRAINNGAYPVAHVVALDGVCVVLHPSNPVDLLTVEQVRDIYAGEITNWSQLGGTDREIVVISRDTSSGTYGVFDDVVMDDEKMAAHVEYVSSNPQAHARVSSTESAIGYVGFGFLDKNVKPIKLNGIIPTQKTIASGSYPIARPLFMFTDGYPELGSMTHRLVTFHLTEMGQDIIQGIGFVPVTSY